jgi:microcystin-dependent protein
MMFGGNFAPRGWATCDGQTLPISQNAALFSILGTTFGGNGTTTFALPDLRGRVPVHPGVGPGLSPYALGQSSGSETVTLLAGQMPAHNHLIGASNQAGTVNDPTNAIAALINTGSVRTPATTALGYTTPPQTGTMAAAAVSATGGGQPHANIQPYLCVNFIIATQGVFPSRN